MGRAGKPDEDRRDTAGDFLSRWSRRKLEAREGGTDTGGVVAGASQATGEADAGGETAQPERELTDADMPPLESLGADSDFTPFMSSGVSDGLRRLALRKLFGQPAFNVTDGLNDYDEDYTQFASLGNVITHEMKRMLKRELERGEEESPPSDAAVAAPRNDDAALPQDRQSPESAAANGGSAGAVADTDDDNENPEQDVSEDRAT
jgi:hypothetical protein